MGKRIPGGFLPEEDQGYVYAVIQLPDAASLQRTAEAGRRVEQIILNTPGVEYCTSVIGFNLLSFVRNTYSGFFFIRLKEWSKRERPEEKATAIIARLNRELGQLPQGIAFAFSPPAIQGVGTAGGVTFILEDRAGKDVEFLADNTQKFIAAARKRPELARVTTTLLPVVPQYFVDVDRDKVLSEGADLGQVYGTLQAFMGGQFVNYFNRFGRQWQVYVEAEADYRTDVRQLGQFYVRNSNGDSVPLAAVTRVEKRTGPEFTMRYNLFRSAQINATAAPGYSSAQAMKALEEVFSQTMPSDMGFDYIGMSFQEQLAQQGISPAAIFALSLLFVFLILAALYESWSLPFSVLLSTPIAVFGAFAALLVRGMVFNIYAQIASDRPHRTGGEERHTYRRICKKRVRRGQRSDGRDTFRSAPQAPSHTDDLLRVHSRLRSTGRCHRSRRHRPGGDGVGRYRRHAHGNRDRHLSHPDAVLRHRKDQQS